MEPLNTEEEEVSGIPSCQDPRCLAREPELENVSLRQKRGHPRVGSSEECTSIKE